MKHVVLGTNILIKQEDAADRTEGGILLPDNAQTKPLKGTVIKKGRGIKEEDIWEYICEEDEVLFDRFAGTPVELDGEEYLIMDIEDILIILDFPKPEGA
jgi:chaperonin GroES